MNDILMDEDYERVVMEIVTNAGQARSCMLNAVHAARSGDDEQCDELVEQAEDCLSQAHLSQTALLQAEVRGEHTPVTLIMVHAQDHLMTGITVKELATEMITEIRARRALESRLASNDQQEATTPVEQSVAA